MKEIWKFLTGINENYAVSSMGRVKSFDRLDCKGRFIKGRVLSSKTNTHNYESVLIHKDGHVKRFYIHRLVAGAFIPNVKNNPCINHKNGNKKDNRVSNLEWCSYQENINHAIKTGLMSAHGYHTKESNKKISKSVKLLWEKGVLKAKKSEDWTPEQRERARIAQLNSAKKRRGAEAPNARKIQCIETGEMFGCIRDADKKYGKQSVKQFFAKKQKTAYGWHWKYMD